MASTYLVGSVKEVQTPVESSLERQLFGEVIGEKDFSDPKTGIPKTKFGKDSSKWLL